MLIVSARFHERNTMTQFLLLGFFTMFNILFYSFPDIPICDYSNPRNNATWICKKPPNSNECQKVVYVQPTPKWQIWKKRIGLVCNKYGCQHTISTNEVKVTGYGEMNKNLPLCKNMFDNFHAIATAQNSKNLDSVTGFVQDNKWRSLVCRGIDEPSSLKFENCLKNKVIYYLGDSTMRQFFRTSEENLKLKSVKAGNDAIVRQRSLVGYDEDNRTITLYYRAHGPLMYNPGPPHSFPFIADTISWIPGGDNVYVVLNIGAHFYAFDPNILIQRLEVIRNSILSHRKKYLKTKFVVRGNNVVETRNRFWEWAIYRSEVILRTFFKNMKNVVFLSMWDLTTVWPLTGDVHPKGATLHEEWILLHSFMCD